MAFQDVGLRVTILGVSQFRRDINSIESSMTRLNRSLGSSSNVFTSLGKNISSLGSVFASVGKTLTYSVTIPLTAAITGLVAAGISFEDAFAGISKTVDGVATDLGELTEDGLKLRKELIALSLEMPISANELARIGMAAGQVGVGADQLLEFTKIAAMMGVATNIASEDAAIALARFANIMGVAEKDFVDWSRRAASTVVELGNNVAATESEIMDLALRIAPAASIVGLTAQEILGLSAALAEVQVRAERGGTAVSRVFLEMMEASGSLNASLQDNKKEYAGMESALQDLRTQLKRGVTDLQELEIGFKDSNLVLSGLGPVLRDYEEGLISIDDVIRHVRNETLLDLESTLKDAQGKIGTFAKIMGVSAEEFAASFGAKPLETFQRFLVELNKLQDAGLITAEQLAEIGLSGVRVREILNILGPNIELVTDNVKMSNKAWIEQTALQVEFQKKMATTKAQIQILKNNIVALGISIFDYLKPSIDATLKSLADFISGLRDTFDTMGDANRKKLLKIVAAVALLGPGLTVVGIALQLIGASLQVFGTLTSLLGIFANPFILSGIIGIGLVFGGLGTPLKIIVDLFQSFVDIVRGATFDSSLNTFEKIQTVFQMLAAMVPELGPVFNLLSDITGTVGELVESFISMGRYYGVFNELEKGIKNIVGLNFKAAADDFKLAWQLMLPWVKNTLIPTLKDALPDALFDLVSRVSEQIGRISEGVQGFIDEVLKIREEDVKTILEGLASALVVVGDAASIALQLALPVLGIGLRTIVEVVADLVRGDVSGALHKLAAGLEAIWKQGPEALGLAIVVLAFAIKFTFVGAIFAAIAAVGKFVIALLPLIATIGIPLALVLGVAIALVYAYTNNLWGMKDAIDRINPKLQVWVGIWKDFKSIAEWLWNHGLSYILSPQIGSIIPSVSPPTNITQPMGNKSPVSFNLGKGIERTSKFLEGAWEFTKKNWRPFAKGGLMSGWGLVGEQGPELLYSSGTSAIFPSSLTKELLNMFNSQTNLTSALTSMMSTKSGFGSNNSTMVFSPNVYGVPMQNEESAGREIVRAYRMAQVIGNV